LFVVATIKPFSADYALLNVCNVLFISLCSFNHSTSIGFGSA